MGNIISSRDATTFNYEHSAVVVGYTGSTAMYVYGNTGVNDWELTNSIGAPTGVSITTQDQYFGRVRMSEDGRFIGLGMPYEDGGVGETGAIVINEKGVSEYTQTQVLRDSLSPYLNILGFGTGISPGHSHSLIAAPVGLLYNTGTFLLWEYNTSSNLWVKTGTITANVSPSTHTPLTDFEFFGLYYNPVIPEVYMSTYYNSEINISVAKILATTSPTTSPTLSTQIMYSSPTGSRVFTGQMSKDMKNFVAVGDETGGSFREYIFRRPTTSSPYTIYVTNRGTIGDRFTSIAINSDATRGIISGYTGASGISSFNNTLTDIGVGQGGDSQFSFITDGSTGTNTSGGNGSFNINNKSNTTYSSGGGQYGSSNDDPALAGFGGGGSGRVNTIGTQGGSGFIKVRYFNSGIL